MLLSGEAPTKHLHIVVQANIQFFPKVLRKLSKDRPEITLCAQDFGEIILSMSLHRDVKVLR